MALGELVTGRVCGDCTVCCTVPAIDDALIQKKSASTCRHCAPSGCGGCGIYETRPQVCRDFHCAWRHMSEMDDRWRPDKSEVFSILERPDSSEPPALTLMLIGNPLRTVRETWFIDFVRKAALKNLPTFLALPGPTGYRPLRALINSPPLTAAARTSSGQVKIFLEGALKFLRVQPFPEHPLKHSGNDASTSPSTDAMALGVDQ